MSKSMGLVQVLLPRLEAQGERGEACRAAKGMLALPFDVIRAQHGTAVQLGLVRRSMLESRDFEAALGALERLLLGPFARRV